jgi:hypothetical protein
MQVLRDAGRAMRSWRSLIRGTVRLIAGGIFATLSLALVLASLPAAALRVFPVFVIITFLTAMLVDALLGDAVRHVFGMAKGSPRPRGTYRDTESGD